MATAPEPASQQTAPGAATNLAREIELVDEANAAMRAGRVHDARATIATYTAEIGDAGQLAEEAAGIEVEALCRLHAEAAPARRAAFERRYPHSLQRAKLAAACDEH